MFRPFRFACVVVLQGCVGLISEVPPDAGEPDASVWEAGLHDAGDDDDDDDAGVDAGVDAGRACPPRAWCENFEGDDAGWRPQVSDDGGSSPRCRRRGHGHRGVRSASNSNGAARPCRWHRRSSSRPTPGTTCSVARSSSASACRATPRAAATAGSRSKADGGYDEGDAIISFPTYNQVVADNFETDEDDVQGLSLELYSDEGFVTSKPADGALLMAGCYAQKVNGSRVFVDGKKPVEALNTADTCAFVERMKNKRLTELCAKQLADELERAAKRAAADAGVVDGGVPVFDGGVDAGGAP